MPESVNKAVGSTAVPIAGTTEGPWGSDAIIPGREVIKAEHMNEIRKIIEDLSTHTHEYNYEYTVPEFEQEVILVGGGGDSAPKADVLGASGTAYANGGMVFKWGAFTTSGEWKNSPWEWTPGNVTFDTAFPGSCFVVILGFVDVSDQSFFDNVFVNSVSAGGFSTSGDLRVNKTNLMTYIAIGN